ncbi:MAG: caspase family protein, partial [Bacillota bacterium]|nr:caspase family protein [Bacillota bacterium]
GSIIIAPEDMSTAGYTPLAGVTVRVHNVLGSGIKELEAITTTRADGRFFFHDISPGYKCLEIQRGSKVYEIRLHIPKSKIPMSYWATSHPKVHYVIIGIDSYPNWLVWNDEEKKSMPVPNYDVSARDALAFKRVFVDQNRMSGTYYLLTNNNATKANIRYAIEKAAWAAGPNDYLVVYFSGYADWEIWAGGVTEPLDHIVPYDGKNYGDINQAVNSVITDGELESWISRFPNKNVTVILDVAYAATFIDGEVREQSADEFELLALKNKGYTVLAAARTDERTKVSPKVGSLFTLSLIKGIYEIPDSYITAYQLFEYARYQMQVVEKVTDQNPVFEGPQNRVVYIRNPYQWR